MIRARWAAYQRIQSEAIPSLGIYQAEPVSREKSNFWVCAQLCVFQTRRTVLLFAPRANLCETRTS